jgi:hypothetical protein
MAELNNILFQSSLPFLLWETIPTYAAQATLIDNLFKCTETINLNKVTTELNLMVTFVLLYNVHGFLAFIEGFYTTLELQVNSLY